ncbi:hypothetical protein B0H14DRAFT_2691696 [Mycena olivaceomarginata]|nr:hypothetical protein B0H14DRAFT_2691696 [Mycena olivaceomarginata]
MGIVGWARLSPSPDLLRLSSASKASWSLRIPPGLVDARSYSTLYDDAVPPWDVGRSSGGTAHGLLLRSFLPVPPRSIWRVRDVRDIGCGCKDVWTARAGGAGPLRRSLSLCRSGAHGCGARCGAGSGRKEGMRAAEREALHFTGHSYALNSRASTLLTLASQLLDLDEARNEGRKARSARQRGSWMWDVRGRVARLRLLPVPASALGPSLPQSQLEQ